MICGEQFQNLATISLCSSFNDIIIKQIVKRNVNLISKTSSEEIKKHRTIFVYTHHLPEFFYKFYNVLEDVTLITHNSDHPVDESFLPLLEKSNIKKWYCQNRIVSHPKLFSLPIGIANSQWVHGNANMLASIRRMKRPKQILVFKNFDCGSNSEKRNLCHRITSSNGIVMTSKTTIDNYWKFLASSIFAISPPGNGIDCHRIWECLALRTVPVVLNHEAFSQFKHLPICFVEKWEDVTITFLKEQKEKYSNTDWDMIHNYMQIENWENQIES
jgi:hypothetical protein